LKWKTVQIPEPLYREVKRVHEEFGYPSVSSMVSAAIRRLLEKIEEKEVKGAW
jgi:Arc/MetJ-type ribon-helix-helix transcriptional regulator